MSKFQIKNAYQHNERQKTDRKGYGPECNTIQHDAVASSTLSCLL